MCRYFFDRILVYCVVLSNWHDDSIALNTAPETNINQRLFQFFWRDLHVMKTENGVLFKQIFNWKFLRKKNHYQNSAVVNLPSSSFSHFFEPFFMFCFYYHFSLFLFLFIERLSRIQSSGNHLMPCKHIKILRENCLFQLTI